MKAEKAPKPIDPPAAVITVNQKELDLLTALLNECHTGSPGVDVMELYDVLTEVGGNPHGVTLARTGTKTYEAVFTVR